MGSGQLAVSSSQSAVGLRNKKIPFIYEEKTVLELLESDILDQIISVGSFKDLHAYKKAFELAMNNFEISKRFPKEETFSLTSQIRDCSRSVCANFAEAYRRRKYRAHFLSKITDSDAENSETGVWLDFSIACIYISSDEHEDLKKKNEVLGKLLGDILKYPDKYL